MQSKLTASYSKTRDNIVHHTFPVQILRDNYPLVFRFPTSRAGAFGRTCTVSGSGTSCDTFYANLVIDQMVKSSKRKSEVLLVTLMLRISPAVRYKFWLTDRLTEPAFPTPTFTWKSMMEPVVLFTSDASTVPVELALVTPLVFHWETINTL